MAHTVIGIFENQSDAQRAAERLESAGVSRSNVDVSRGSQYRQNVDSDNDSDNSLSGFFKNLFGGDSDDADRYSRASSSGDRSIVTVHAHTAEEAERAADLLDEYGAINIDEERADYSRQGVSGDQRDYDRTGRSDQDQTIQRVEENLNVGKREVQGGGVRVRSRIVERPVEEHLRLREEHVHVERNPVNRALNENDRVAFQEQNIELTERSEVPVVNKEARVVEEIKISREVNERNETVRDTVRNTEVDIDKIDRNDDRRNRDQRGYDESRNL